MKKALFVGINEYPGERKLQSCVLDANRMKAVLHRHEHRGDLNFECQTLLGEEKAPVTREMLSKELHKLFDCRSCTDVLFYFSGHGSKNVYDGYLITSDYTKEQPGLPFKEVLDMIQSSPTPNIYVILDCCYSGAFGEIIGSTAPTAQIKSGVSILSACSENEFAKENGQGGIFTSIVVSALKGQAADVLGNVTMAGIYAHADKLLTAWEQRPTFKANVNQLNTLRKVKPKTTEEQIRRLTVLFPEDEYKLQLDHSYEKHKCEVPRFRRRRNQAREAELKELQDFRAAGLVEPLEHDNLYDACIKRGKCQLTPIGRFYWHMVKKGKI